ncbi:formate dehydrogenase [Cryptococcus neoformans Tu401-1]|nr:formate dehydrogenase [Cryptococcus neoformans var. grubii Bt85]OXG21149.1 formate dehydrogenase [Cryptococcus neoformans var. grubii Tu401-1]
MRVLLNLPTDFLKPLKVTPLYDINYTFHFCHLPLQLKPCDIQLQYRNHNPNFALPAPDHPSKNIRTHTGHWPRHIRGGWIGTRWCRC